MMLAFVCPSCGLDCVAESVPGGPAQVVHRSPPCAVFLDLDALDFLRLARKKTLGPMPWDPPPS